MASRWCCFRIEHNYLTFLSTVFIIVSYIPWISAVDDWSTRFSRFRTRYSCKLCFSYYRTDQRKQWSVCSGSQVTLSQEKESYCRGVLVVIDALFILCMECSPFYYMSKFIVSLWKGVGCRFFFSCLVAVTDFCNDRTLNISAVSPFVQKHVICTVIMILPVRMLVRHGVVSHYCISNKTSAPLV